MLRETNREARVSDFRKLRIWQRAGCCRRACTGWSLGFRLSSRTRRGDQLIRAAISIRHNISEGSGRRQRRRSLRAFCRIAIASANELDDGIEELDDVGLLPPEDRDLLTEPRELAAMIAAFRKRVTRRLRAQSDDSATATRPVHKRKARSEWLRAFRISSAQCLAPSA